MSDSTAVVLVVDDNEMNRDMLARRIRRQQHRVELAADGALALKMVAEQPFDLILLDIMMPNINGYEVLRQLKDNPQTRHIPVIMISAVDDLDSVVKCIEMGADDYLFKPFNPVLLKARVNASLQRMRGVTPLQAQPHLEAAESVLVTLRSQCTEPEAIAELEKHLGHLRNLFKNT